MNRYPWAPLLRKRETWAFALGKGLTDPVWWFYLFWLPKYLQETFGLSLFQAIVPLLVLYNLTTIGSIGGGWLSSTLIDRGWTVNKARKTAMFITHGTIVTYTVFYLHPCFGWLRRKSGLLSLEAACAWARAHTCPYRQRVFVE